MAKHLLEPIAYKMTLKKLTSLYLLRAEATATFILKILLELELTVQSVNHSEVGTLCVVSAPQSCLSRITEILGL